MTPVRLLLAALLTLAAPPIVRAQSHFGMAGVTCAQFIKAARSSDMLYHQAAQWLLGYVSGMNAAMRSASGTTPVGGMTNDQILKSAGAYCDANPGSNLANAANEWYATVPKQSDPKAADAQPQKPAGSGSLILNLDNAPARKPLMDRR